MKKIKEKLIHWLGGKSKEEVGSKCEHCSNVVLPVILDDLQLKTYTQMLDFAKSLNGLSADEWCDKMYRQLEDKVHHISSRLDAPCQQL